MGAHDLGARSAVAAPPQARLQTTTEPRAADRGTTRALYAAWGSEDAQEARAARIEKRVPESGGDREVGRTMIGRECWLRRPPRGPAGWPAPRGDAPALGDSRAAIEPYAESSPRYRDSRFHNSTPVLATGRLPVRPRKASSRAATSGGHAGRSRSRHTGAGRGRGVAVTWFGHRACCSRSTDAACSPIPYESERVSPSAVVGQARMHPVPMALADLRRSTPSSSRTTTTTTSTRRPSPGSRARRTRSFVVPIGVGPTCAGGTSPSDRIVELDWDESAEVNGLVLTCTERSALLGPWVGSRHDAVVVVGDRRTATRVFFGGDSGYTAAFRRSRPGVRAVRRHAVAGGCLRRALARHSHEPRGAVLTHLDVAGALLIPIHWATSTSRSIRGGSRSPAWSTRRPPRRWRWRSRWWVSGSTRCAHPSRSRGGRRWLSGHSLPSQRRHQGPPAADGVPVADVDERLRRRGSDSPCVSIGSIRGGNSCSDRSISRDSGSSSSSAGAVAATLRRIARVSSAAAGCRMSARGVSTL